MAIRICTIFINVINVLVTVKIFFALFRNPILFLIRYHYLPSLKKGINLHCRFSQGESFGYKPVVYGLLLMLSEIMSCILEVYQFREVNGGFSRQIFTWSYGHKK